MKTLRNAVGLGALAATLTAFDYKDPKPDITGPEHFDTPVVYDVGNSRELFQRLKDDPSYHFTLAEQVLRTLESTVKPDSKKMENGQVRYERDLPSYMPGTIVVSVTELPISRLTINGFTKMQTGSPYYFADNPIFTTSACGQEGETNLTVTFRNQTSTDELHQSVKTFPSNISKTVSTVDWRGQKLVVTGEEHAERMEAYTQLAARVACRVQEALNM